MLTISCNVSADPSPGDNLYRKGPYFDDDDHDNDNGDDDNGDDDNGDDDNGNGAAYGDQTWRRPSYDPGTNGCTVAQHCVCFF